MPLIDQGVSSDRFMVIPRVLIFLRRGNDYLLLKGSPHKRLWANKYNGIGGHIEQGESVLFAARRELKEETSLIADLRLCGTVMVDTNQQIGICIYVVTGNCDEGEPEASDEGISEWIDFGQISNLPAVADVQILLNKIHGMHPGDQPFSAKSYYDEKDQLRVEFTE
jgi:8-oxo-dGTP diphosphatase